MISDVSILSMREDLKWLETMIHSKVNSFLDDTNTAEIIEAPNLEDNKDLYSDIVSHYKLSLFERGMFAVAFAKYFYSQIFDSIVDLKVKYPNRTQIGGSLNHHTSFSPNLEFVFFLFTNESLEERIQFYQLFNGNSNLIKFNIVEFESNSTVDFWKCNFQLSSDYIQLILTGYIGKPNFTADFPAKLLHTKSSWSDLVLPHETFDDLNEIITWYNHENKIRQDWGFHKIIKPGFRTVFFGPSGTGKSFTAALLGQKLGVDVYRIDLTRIVSKYIGETAKNLENLFKQAENKNWILFFDEAESLFGKRTTGGSVNDKYANQEVGYLLQRIEDYPGIVILATNLKSQMDDAFMRRFQNFIHFPSPDPELRETIWRNAFKNENSELSLNIDFKKISFQFELTGGMICNVIRTCILQSIIQKKNEITTFDVEIAAKKELSKMGQFYSNR